MHRFTLSIVAALLTLSFASGAHAALVCEDAVGQSGAPANFQWDEIPEPSRSLYLDLEGCACGTPTWTGGPPATLGACSGSCSFTDGSNDWGCGLTWGVCDPALDPACDYATYYSWSWAQHDACDACIASTCGAEANACAADVAPSP